MKIRLVQKDVHRTDYRPYLDRAAADNVGLLVFGELATSGALYTPREVPSLDEILGWFRPYSYRIMTGLPYVENGRLRNAFVYYHQGATQIYHKVNLFPGMNEDKVYQPGTEPGLWETDFGKVGATICYDLRFPEVYRRLAELGAKWIFVPAAWPRVRVADFRRLLVERAQEHGVYMFGINSVGDDGTNVFGGSTTVVDPAGKVLAQAEEASEALIDVEV